MNCNRIGSDVWIGYAATFMLGVKVGDGAMIATQSIVTKDLPAYAVVGGNPATVIRYRFDEQSIERLLRIRWWDWDAEKIARNVKVICSGDIDAFGEQTG